MHDEVRVTDPSRPSRTVTIACLAAILAVTFGLFAPSLSNTFAMDDRLVAKSVLDNGQRNELVAELRPVDDYLSRHYWHAAQPDSGDLYRPATIASYALVKAAFVPPGASEEREAFPQHAVNVLLHLAGVVIVFALVRPFARTRAPALAAALVFGVHAIHSEIVAGIVGRAELLAFTFGGGATLLLLALERASGLRTLVSAATAAAFAFLAFASKESALAWAPLFLVLAVARRSRLRAVASGAVAFALAAAAFLWLRAGALADVAGPDVPYVINPLVALDAWTRSLNAIRIWGYGLLLTLLPFELAADYGHSTFRIIESPVDLGFVLALAALSALLVVGLLNVRRRPLVFVAAASFLGLGFMTSNLPFAIGTIFGERLYYAPSLGLAFGVAWIVLAVEPSKNGRRAVAVATFGWLVLSGATVLARNGVWRNDDTLFAHEALNQPLSARMQLCAATQASRAGDAATAEEHLKTAVAVDPEYALAWNNLSALYLSANRFEEAEYCVERGLLAQHKNESEDLFKLHCNRGIVLAALGREQDAIEALEESLGLRPDFQRARVDLLNLLAVYGSAARIVEVLREGEARTPGEPAWSLFRGLLDHRTGRHASAVAHLAEGLSEPPKSRANRYLARYALADSLLWVDRGSDAVSVFSGLALDPTAPSEFRRRAAARLDGLTSR